MTDIRPIIFGKHCLLERISVGGMAEVYRARPFNAPEFRRFLAVKRILPNLAADDEFISMFVDEAKIAVQLNHRSVCQIYELGRLEGTFYIVMEFIAGKDVLALQNWFRKRRKIMSVAQAAWIAAQVCDGLDYAHRKSDDDGNPLNIIHRDISPQNVLVSYDGDVKLIDFGIARAATTNATTQVGVLKGKFGYMSPEQVDAKELDHRSDIFAVGTLLWEMLTARRLFHADSDFATLEKVRSAPIEPPSAKNSRVPAEIDRIVMKALERDRDTRYQWASEMADDLRAFLADASPNYSAGRLSSWMIRNFPDELEVERRKVGQFADFVTVDDVYAYYALHPETEAAAVTGDEDEEEATQVFDPARHKTDVSGNESDEVLAENEMEPLPTVVQMASELGTGLPEVDLDITVDDGEIEFGSDPMSSFAAPARVDAQSTLPPPRRRSPVLPIVLGVIVLAAAAAGLWFALLAPPSDGTLVVNTTPGDGVTVYLDGEPHAGAMPIRIEGVAAGSHLLELRHPDHEPVLAEVEVVAETVTNFSRELVPVSAGVGTVGLSISEPNASVFVDGAVVGGQGANRTFEVSAGEPHVVEVYAPGFFVEEYELQLNAEGRFDRTVELRPVVASITIGSQPAGDVFLDGEARGSTDDRLTISGLDVRNPIALEIRPRSRSFRPYETTVVFDTYYDLRLHPLLPRRGTEQTDDAPAFGFMATAEGEDWYRVFVDGRDTGLVTPIPEDQPLALKAGERTISFVRPHDRRDARILIADGETMVVNIPGE